MSTDTSAQARPVALSAFIAVAVTAVVAGVGNTVVSLLARALGASGDFRPLQPATYLFLTVLGTIAGVVGWLVTRRTARPHATLRWLAPVVVVVSWVPDVLLGTSQSQPHTTWIGVVGLMVMHLVVAGTAVAVFGRELPLPADDATVARTPTG